jgi:hypothetical protein
MREADGLEVREPIEPALRDELNRILDGPAFRTSKRCREFLEYVVQNTVHGPNGSLKERAIGIDLFNLAEDFDPSQHTIVRVTANEVRKRLAQHYLAEIGTPHAVRIKLPPGSYKTEFRRDTVAVAPAAELSPPQPPSPEELPVEEMPTTKPPDASHPGRLRFVVVASVVKGPDPLVAPQQVRRRQMTTFE